MSDVKVENIVTYAQIADGLNIEQIVEKIPEFNYNPNEFAGLTIKLEDPKTAVLILPGGKAICTGAKSVEDAEASIKKIVSQMKKKKIELNKNVEIRVQSIVVSIDLKKELHLSSISSGLVLEHVEYEPKQFPGLIYRMNDIGATLIVFSSGKIVCTGTKTIDDATNAIKLVKEKLSSIGAL